MQGERYRRRLQQLADRLHRCRVDFIGYAGGARKHAVWQLADLYVFPSRHESYGLTLAEALAAGLPVVTTNHYSAPDLVPPEVGVVVPNRPESAVAPALWAAIRDLLADDDRRAALAFAAREQGHRLRFEAAAQRVLEICGEVLPSA